MCRSVEHPIKTEDIQMVMKTVKNAKPLNHRKMSHELLF